jgi:hypothetical protein
MIGMIESAVLSVKHLCSAAASTSAWLLVRMFPRIQIIEGSGDVGELRFLMRLRWRGVGGALRISVYQ